MITSIRWRLFKFISAFGWWVCPEPYRTRLQSVMQPLAWNLLEPDKRPKP